MSQNKNNIVAIGPGNIIEILATSRSFGSNARNDFYDNAATYATLNTVEFNGDIYRSLDNGNVGNQPDLSPTKWELMLKGVRDGDVCWTVAGNNSDLQIRTGDLWKSIGGQPAKIALNDGQIAPAVAFSYNAGNFAFSEINYTVRRGSGHGRKRKGRFTILNDGTGQINFSHEFEEIGTDPNVDFTIGFNAGAIEISYTSALEGVTIELALDLGGWT